MNDLPPNIYASYEDAGIEVPWNRRSGEVKVFCPWCHAGRQHNRDKSLRVNLDKGTWHCHHPGCPTPNGGLDRGPDWRTFSAPAPKKAVPPPAIPEEAYDAVADGQDWLKERGIDQETVDRNRVVTFVDRIAFPFYRAGVHINTQWRMIDPADPTSKTVKRFWFEEGCDRDFYGLDDVMPEEIDTWIIVEGMMDKLAIESATGYLNVISVPNGKNSKLNELLPPLTERLKRVKKFILAGDRDEAGSELMTELSRRLGKEKCWTVQWTGKDANDTLMSYGPEVVGACLNDARPEPIEGIFRPRDLVDAVIALKYQGEHLGVPAMNNALGDQLRIAKGMSLTVSGIPGSGKSRGLDNIITDTGRGQGWRWAICSPESWPLALHQKHLIQIASGKSVAGEAKLGIDPMMNEEIRYWSEQVDKYVAFVKPETMSVASIWAAIEKEMMQNGVDAVLLDPWNRLGHQVTKGLSMTDYVGVTLADFKQKAQRHDFCFALAAHPAKPERAKDDGNGFIIVKPYDIADSHNFFDMSDFVITFARHKDDIEKGTLVSIGKVKTEEYGHEGSVLLQFDPVTSRLSNFTGVPR